MIVNHKMISSELHRPIDEFNTELNSSELNSTYEKALLTLTDLYQGVDRENYGIRFYEYVLRVYLNRKYGRPF